VEKDRLASNAIIIRQKDDSHEQEIEGAHILNAPLEDLAAGKHTNPVALGILGGLLGLEKTPLLEVVGDFFSSYGQDLIDRNKDSVTAGYDWVLEQAVQGPDIQTGEAPKERITLSGHDALALGAMTAGLKFYSFYPMSPSTSISTPLINAAHDMGLIVEQCEDEIAVINMALAASYAGAPSMVGTSGGGFALMCEGVSLAGIAEVPVVIVVAQRPGPATGLATRTEQGDLLFTLFGGHGEFPKAIFSPGTIGEIFESTRHAFKVAALSRGPVIILTDQFIADSHCGIEPFNIDDMDPVQWINPPQKKDDPFLPYAITESGVSPSLAPGLTTEMGSLYDSPQLVLADSHEHTEDGHMSEDPDLRSTMVRKRLAKEKVIRDNLIGPEVWGEENPDLLLIGWGATKAAIAEAARKLESSGSVGCFHLSQVWPLPGDELTGLLNGAKRTVCVENNATGQLALLLRSEIGFRVDQKILKYDGRSMTPEFILRELKEG
jgi:2-oxoglutarate ferredoxin oxidoreductase subunit alpha